MTKSLYELIGLKRKKSVLKSVFLEEDNTYCGESGWTRFAVECYDSTFEKAMEHNADNTFDYIDKSIKKYMIQNDITQALVIHYSLFYNHYEYPIKLVGSQNE